MRIPSSCSRLLICFLILLSPPVVSPASAEDDTTPPVITVTANGSPLAEGSVYAGQVTPEITADDDASSVTVEATLNGLPYVSGTTITEGGQHVLSITATDAASNAVSLLRTFWIEEYPPLFERLSPAEGTVTSAAEVTLWGRVIGAAELTVDGATVALLGSGDFTAGPYALAEGERTFTLVATSPGGQTTQLVHHLTRDATPPSISLTSPAEDAVLSTRLVTVTGTASDAHLSSVEVNGRAASVDGTTFTAVVGLPDGRWTLSARAADAAGNAGEASRQVTVDTRAPVVAVTDPAPGTVVPEAMLTISGTARDPHLDRVEVAGATATLTGERFSIEVTLAEGVNTFVATAYDTLGHQGTAGVEVTRESAAPSVRIDSPAEGLVTSASTVDVSGTVTAGATVTVNGEAATMTGGAFSAAGIELFEGENRLIARATDADGDEGVYTRMVTRDSAGPSWVGSDPLDGAAGIAPGTVLAVGFDELLAAPAAGSWRLETAAGTSIAASASLTEGVLEVRPDAALPASSEVRLVLTAALTDLAGNALVNPGTLSFTTTDGAAAGPPVIDAVPPRYLCAFSWTLTGTATANALVRVEGGAGAAEARAEADGSFVVPVSLLPGRLHRLSVTSTVAGVVSPATVVEVVQDCAPPAVTSAERAGDVFTVSFSEPVQPSTVDGAITLSDASGAVAGTVVVTTAETATWTASSALPSGTYLLQVSQTVIDLAGNALAFPYSRVFSDAAEESFFSGTVIDEVTGRPLSGARVVVTATGGEATAEPRPEQTTGADGRFLIAVPAGTHGVTVARPGYTPVFRIVTTVEGLGTEVFDPRLTPASEARAVTAAAGGTVEVEGASLDVPAQALAADASVTLTAVGEQGLAALLPYGWTPRGAVWLDVEEELTSPATLSFAVESPNGATLTVAKLDVATLQWRSVDDVLVVVGEVTVTVSTFGAYAAVEPDTGALEPPPAVVGEVLGSSPAPEGGEVTAAAVSFEPAIVTPDQTADATAVYTLASEVASGLPLTMVIREELELLDGTIRRFAPFRADVVLYRALDGTPRSRFRLRPSTAARTTPIRGGGLELRVVPYGDESVRGNVLGPEGGTVVGDAGDRLAVAAGALTTPTAVTLTRRTVAELPLSAPAGGTVDGVVEVDLGGAELAVPGALTLSMGTPPSAGEVGLLLLVVDAGGTPRYRAVAELAPSASGWTTRAIVAADLPWPGVTTGGHYVFLRLSVPLAFVRGTAYRVDGTPLAGGIVEAAGVDWIQITGADGRYVLPVPVGEATTIAITNPATGNAVASTVTAAAGNERIDLDPRLLIVGPSVVETSPIGGAVAPAGVEPTVRFSEPVDPASLAAGITLVHGTETVAVSFDAQGSLVTVLPAATLAPGGAYELRIGMEVRDLQGYALAYPVSVGFAIQVPALPSEIDLTKVFLVEPDGSGTAQVLGHPGAVPANTLVWVENLTSYSTTESTTSAANGSFALAIGATLTDQLLFHVLVQGGNEVVSLLGPYMTADLKGAWAGPEGTSFVTVEGVAVTVEEGTFTALARVRAQLRPAAEPSIEMPEDLAPLAALALDFGGAEAQKPLGLRLPGPAPSTAGPYLLNRIVEVLGRGGWMIHDLLRWEAGAYTNEPAPPGGGALTAPSVDAKGLKTGSAGDYVTGALFAGEYQLVEPLVPMSFVAAPYFAADVAFFSSWEGFVTQVSAAVARILPGAVLLPIRAGAPYALELVDLTTGFTSFADTLPAPAGALEVLPQDAYGDILAPYPTGGSPLRFYVVGAEESLPAEVAARITRGVAGGALTITGAAGATQQGAAIRLLGLDDAASVSATAAADGSFTVTTPANAGNRYVLAIGARVSSGVALEIAFNEALAIPPVGIEVKEGTRTVPVEVKPLGVGSRVRLRPAAGWLSGRSYTLRLTPALADQVGNAWSKTLEVPFEVVGGSVSGGIATGAARDSARLGNLLFVAADSQGLVVLDAGDPDNLKNYLPNGGALPLALADPVRGVAVDPHGRVTFVGGGTTGFGQLKILDPLAIDVAAIAADPTNDALLQAAIRGSTLLTDQVGGTNTQLPDGLPRRVAVLPNDAVRSWRWGEAAPADLVLSPAQPPAHQEVTLTVSGTSGTPGQPVTLHNLTRGTWSRVDATTGGSFSISMTAGAGEALELRENRGSVAYVTIDGYGLMAVALAKVYDEDLDSPALASAALRDYTNLPVSDPCPSSGWVPFRPVDVEIVPGAGQPLTLAVLNQAHGLVMLTANPDDPRQLEVASSHCTEVDGDIQVGGLAVAAAYPMDTDGDGTAEPHDYVLVTNAAGWLLIYDATDRAAVTQVGRIELPGPASAIAVDRLARKVYVAAGTAGIYVVSFDEPPSLSPRDADGDGIDDRVLETIAVAGEDIASLLLAPELGLVFAGGFQQGVSRVTAGGPRISLVTEDAGRWREVGALAPFGVPTGPEAGAGTPERPDLVRVRLALPGSVDASVVRVDLVSVSPGGLEIDGAGNPAQIPDLPPTTLRDLELRRQGADPAQSGYNLFLSEPVVLLADLRASVHYQRTDAEKDPAVCTRCDLVAAGVYTAAQVAAGDVYPELLSGHRVAVRLPALRAPLEGVYGPFHLDAAETEVTSVPWDLSPAVRQEPALSPSYGTGDVAPGTLLHSGEMTASATDLAIRGRGFDFAFTRTYRSQTVGGGPLGPGWDHNYRLRLRPLPNGDVEYFDGRGRRELFRRDSEGKLIAPKGHFVTLERTSAGFVMVDAGRNMIRFDAHGQLQSIADAVKTSEATGNAMTFSHDSRGRLVRVTDTLDRSVDFEYDIDGRLVKITDFTGRDFEYVYDVGGKLREFKTPALTTIDSPSTPQPLSTKYLYTPTTGDLAGQLNSRNNLATVTDPKDQTWLALTYTDADGDGRTDEVTQQTWGPGTLSIAYDFTPRTANVTDRRGNVSEHRHNEAGQLIRFKDPAQAVWTWAYDDEGLLTEEQLPLGRRTDYVYDTGAFGRRSRGNLKVATVTADSRGGNGSSTSLSTSYAYEQETNQPIRVIHPWGALTVIDRSETGLPQTITEAQGSEDFITLFEYNAYGQPTEVTNPNDHVTALTYSASGANRGYLESVTVDPSGLNLTTTYETDARGNVTRVTDPRGVEHESDYNDLDWLIETRQAAGVSGAGLVPLGYTHRTRYDGNGNVAEVEIPFGDGSQATRVRSTYGVLDELIDVSREIEPGDSPEEWAVTRYEYDPNLNVTKVIQPEGNAVELTYDARNLLESRTRGVETLEASTVQYTYDAEREPTGVQDGRGSLWSTQRDGYGRVSKALDPLGNAAVLVYDNAHNVAEQRGQDAEEVLLSHSSFQYDPLNRPTSRRLSHGFHGTALSDVLESVGYDRASNVLTAIDPRGYSPQLGYDAAERLAQRIDPKGNVASLTYDASSNVIHVEETDVHPGGSTVVTREYDYDALSRLIEERESDGRSWPRQYDARGQLISAADPEGNVTTYGYDGLNRMVRETRPEGVEVTYVYDDNSRLVTYRDALGQETLYEYDDLDRRTQVSYPDQTTESFEYDANNNVIRITDARGNVIDQTYDGANRMTSREITLAAGVEGVTAESYAYDGLGRLTHAVSGSVTTTLAYDSLSRVRAETTNGKTVAYEYDPSSNVERLTYPSADAAGSPYTVTREFDELDRTKSMAWLFDDGGPPPPGLQQPGPPVLKDAFVNPVVGYEYQGPYRMASKTLRGGLAWEGQATYDATRRLLGWSSTNGDGHRVFAESLSWYPRNVKQSITRGDLNDARLNLTYDGASRLLAAQRQADASNAFTAGLPQQWSFEYDEAQNLLERNEDGCCGDTTQVAMPPDDSQRNRPESVGGTPLAWDGSGNLTSKGSYTFHYDYRNRLIKVEHPQQATVEYAYDAFNRRVEKRVAGGATETTVWSGWRELETYANGVLKERVTYGAGLDEIVRLENVTSGLVHLPVYDATGNLVMVLDAGGHPVERYEYSPFGERWIFADSDPPEIEQVRLKDGAIWLEISEEVDFEELQAAVGDGRLVLTDEDANETLAVAVTRPVGGGRQAGRRAVITPATPPAVGTQVKLEMPARTLFDFFGNAGEDSLALTFDWPAGDLMFLDAVAPRVEQVCTKNGALEVQFSEEVDLSLATGLILVDGQAQTWSLAPDRYTLVSAPLTDGVHELSISAGSALDLDGQGLASGFSETFSVGGGTPAEQVVWSAGAPGSIASSAVANRFGFHGRLLDAETGLLYFRNRYYDPELGRFITVDPLGYLDGPSLYSAFGSNPYSFTDPLGLELDFSGDKRLESSVNRLRARSPRIDATLQMYEGIGKPDLIFQREGDLPRDSVDGSAILQHFIAEFDEKAFGPISTAVIEATIKGWQKRHADAMRGKGSSWGGPLTLDEPPIFATGNSKQGGNDSFKLIEPASVRLRYATIVVSVKKNRAGSVEEAYSLIHELGHAEHAASNPWEHAMQSSNDMQYRDFDFEQGMWVEPIPHDDREVEKYANRYRDDVGRELANQTLRSAKEWYSFLKKVGFQR